MYLQEKPLFLFFESVVSQLKLATPADASKWIVGELNALVKDSGKVNISVDPHAFAELIEKCQSGDISTKMVKEIIPKLLDGVSLEKAIASMGGSQISDEDALQAVVATVLAQNPDVVEKIKNGKTGSANFLMGQVMKETKGRAKPDTVRELILNACKD